MGALYPRAEYILLQLYNISQSITWSLEFQGHNTELAPLGTFARKKRQGPNGPPVGTTETRPQAVPERRYRPYRELGTMSPEFQAQDRCLIMSDNKTLSDIMAQARLRRFKAFLGQKTACCGPFVQKTQSPFIPSSLDVDSSRLPSDAGRAHPRPWLRAHGRRGRRRGPVPAVCHRYSSPVLY